MGPHYTWDSITDGSLLQKFCLVLLFIVSNHTLDNVKLNDIWEAWFSLWILANQSTITSDSYEFSLQKCVQWIWKNSIYIENHHLFT